MGDLDATAQKLLQKDPSNPNSPKKVESGRGLSRSTATASKPSLREAMLGQKRAMAAAAKNLPARPGSAMSHFSPTRNVSNSSATSTTSVATKPAVRSRAEPSISMNAGGMSVAPMRPSRRRPEVARPATAGPYSMRDQPSSMEVDSPDSLRASKPLSPRRKAAVPASVSPVAARSRPGHMHRGSESSIPSPTARTTSRPRVSPRPSPARPIMPPESPTRDSPTRFRGEHAIPKMVNMESSATIVAEPQTEYARSPVSPNIPKITLDRQPLEESPPLKIYEDPGVVQHQSPKAATPPVLEDKPVNEDVAKLQRANGQVAFEQPPSPEKTRQNSRLLDSGISKIKAKSLETHGFRKLQSLIRDPQTEFTDDKFEAVVVGLFDYLADPLDNLPEDKVPDVKAQVLTTLKMLLKKERDNFQPHVSKGLEALLLTRAAYDSRAHVVSGLELLADELVAIGNAPEIVVVLSAQMSKVNDSEKEGCRTLSMGLHVLKEMLDAKSDMYSPSDKELEQLFELAGRCLESADSGVRMDAVKFCVALHGLVGKERFWAGVGGVKDDPKSLITYYIAKGQREIV